MERARPRAVLGRSPRHGLRDRLRRWPPTTRSGRSASRSPRSPAPPTSGASPPAFLPDPLNNKLWHIPFNRVETCPSSSCGSRGRLFGYDVRDPGRRAARRAGRLLRRPWSPTPSRCGAASAGIRGVRRDARAGRRARSGRCPCPFLANWRRS
jgi:hypothetical protein